MKTVRFALLFSFAANIACAQFSAGIKINAGFGGIRSSNLQKNLNYQSDLNPKITEWSAKQSLGFVYGFGAFAAYRTSDRFTLVVEPAVQFLRCNIDITRIENKVNNNGDGDVNTETTNSVIHVSYLNLPVLARYTPGSGSFFVQGGFGINFTGHPTITSTENSIKDSYKSGALDKTTTDAAYSLKTTLNVFDSPRIDFILGLGKSFEVNDRTMSIDLRYNFPLTKSEMYTTDSGYNDGRFKENDLLGLGGKTEAEKNAPNPLNDFKMSSILLSFNLALFSN